MSAPLAGKVAVVTGGSGVLGREMCRALAGAGASVVVLGRGYEKAEAVAAELRASGGKALAVSADVCDPAAMALGRDASMAALGGCDILVCAAGGNDPAATTAQEGFSPADLAATALNTAQGAAAGKPSGGATNQGFFDLDPAAFEAVFNRNFLGVLVATQAFGPDLAARSGTIVAISSMGAFRPLTKVPAYSAAKAAVSNFTEWLAVHFAPVGIRVNAIAPGFFLTEQNRALLTNPDGSLTPRAGKIIAHTPLGRFGRPEDLSGALLWLCDSSASAFVTGVVLPVDGGFNAFSGV
jgi:NAD(P)-dependent dehydrogenase (short-subunit alcohol dehydrogenase family)